MAKYHINPATGRPNICGASAGKCPFGDKKHHYGSKAEARAAYEASMAEATLPQPATKDSELPAIHPPSLYKLRQPSNYDFNDIYEYDSYSTYNNRDYYDDSEDDPWNSNYSTYEGLRMGTVGTSDVYSAVASRIGAPTPTPWKPEYYEMVANGGTLPPDLKAALDAEMSFLTDSENWEVHAVGDYYGDTAEVEEPGRLQEIIEDWYWQQPGAMDEHKILPYVRGRGIDTTGLKPLDAIKQQLDSENHGRKHSKVARAKQVEVKRISPNSIIIPNRKHFDSVEAREPIPVAESGSSQVVMGVVVQIPGGYELVDGYHRMKDCLDKKTKKQQAFIVLS